jgi:DnaJ-class molecular chaperone
MDDALHVYKILLLDSSSVKEAGLAPQALKSGFRGLAKSLHPDKNRHPLSKEAF